MIVDLIEDGVMMNVVVNVMKVSIMIKINGLG